MFCFKKYFESLWQKLSLVGANNMIYVETAEVKFHENGGNTAKKALNISKYSRSFLKRLDIPQNIRIFVARAIPKSRSSLMPSFQKFDSYVQ